MSESRSYFVYILASFSKVLYIGVTGDLEGRVGQHKSAKIDGFTKRYNCFNLVYFEEFDDIEQAILREKQLKSWSRFKKEFLIESKNPTWSDLAQAW